MSPIVYRTLTVLCELVLGLQIGTNLGLLHVLLALVSGQLLLTRGALFPALDALGLRPAAVRRAWAAVSGGDWAIRQLLQRWQTFVQRENRWHAHRHGGYQALAVDTSAFFRPRLHACPTKHYHPQAGKALPAIPFGLIGRVGSVTQQRQALPLAFVRASGARPSESSLQQQTVRQAVALAEAQDVLVVDRGFKLKRLQHAQVKQYVARGPKNFTARRSQLPDYVGRGRPPTFGLKVRPLPRRYKGKTTPATVPDHTESWSEHGTTLRADWWYDLVLPDARPGAATFQVVVIHDPRWTEPLVLLTNLRVAASLVRDLFHDRWPIEQLPLVAKQLIGAERQWVSAPEACQRLPELALFAGCVLSYLAATLPCLPSGFWDRTPRRTAGRLRRVLLRADFFTDFTLPERIREKASLTTQLPKGISALLRHFERQHSAHVLPAPAI